MSFASLADLANDQDFRLRIAACATSEDSAKVGEFPVRFAERIVWRVAAAPGFAAAYESAQAGEVARPGRDPAVISDSQILSAVQPIVASAIAEGLL